MVYTGMRDVEQFSFVEVVRVEKVLYYEVSTTNKTFFPCSHPQQFVEPKF